MSIIGKNLPRVDAEDKARGKVKYTGDYYAPGMLSVALSRAKLPHAVIRGIKIPEIPGGIFVYTAKDLPCNLVPSIKNDQPALADEKIRYYGEPYAVVAAETREEAQKFADSIELIADPLPTVDDMQEAVSENAQKVHEGGNLCYDLHFEKGDIENAWQECGAVFEDTFRLPVQCAGFLENESAFTYIDEKGRLALVSSTQNAFDDKKVLCQVLDLPTDRVTSRAAAVGGAFGAKDGNCGQIYPAIITHFTGRPAKYIYSKEESIRYGWKRHAAVEELKVGFSEDGLIRALSGRLWMDTGAYTLLGTAVLELGTEHMTGPYYVPDADLSGWLCYTNHTPASAVRGFGAPQTVLGIETLMDRAAEHFGIDRLEIRRRNALHRGQTGPCGAEMKYAFGFEEALLRLKETDLYKEMTEHPEPGCGYGISGAMKSYGMGKGCPDDGICEIERLPEGGYRVRISAVDIGEGAETAFTMMAAEALDVSADKITVCLADTEETADTGSTAASRLTYIFGRAISEAAEIIKQGKNYAKAKASVPVSEGHSVHALFTALADAAKVRIDPVTGAVNVLEVVNVTDAGTVIHQGMMDGQVIGGIVMSLGYTLSEEIRYKEGKTLETGLANYIMPTALDAPDIKNFNVVIPEESNPFGAKGIGEASTVPVIPAITAAVRDLCPGIPLTSLPVSREEVLKYYKGKEQ